MRTTILMITSPGDHTQDAEHCKHWQTSVSDALSHTTMIVRSSLLG